MGSFFSHFNKESQESIEENVKKKIEYVERLYGYDSLLQKIEAELSDLRVYQSNQ